MCCAARCANITVAIIAIYNAFQRLLDACDDSLCPPGQDVCSVMVLCAVHALLHAAETYLGKLLRTRSSSACPSNNTLTLAHVQHGGDKACNQFCVPPPGVMRVSGMLQTKRHKSESGSDAEPEKGAKGKQSRGKVGPGGDKEPASSQEGGREEESAETEDKHVKGTHLAGKEGGQGKDMAEEEEQKGGEQGSTGDEDKEEAKSGANDSNKVSNEPLARGVTSLPGQMSKEVET